MAHPPYSSDLNPIEKIWAWMKHKLVKLNPKSSEELKESIKEVWEELDIEMVNRFVDHMYFVVE